MHIVYGRNCQNTKNSIKLRRSEQWSHSALKLWQNMRFQKCQLFAKLPQGITLKCLKFFPISTGFFRVAQNWKKKNRKCWFCRVFLPEKWFNEYFCTYCIILRSLWIFNFWKWNLKKMWSCAYGIIFCSHLHMQPILTIL